MAETKPANAANELSDEFNSSIWTFYQTNLSARTRKEYLNIIRNFAKLTKTDPLKLTKEAAECYINELNARYTQKKLSYNTLVMRISVMRSLCEYIRYRREQQGISYYNYFNDIIVPEQDKTLLEENLPTDSEINALLELAADADDDTAFLVFSLAVKCGLTSSEISKLDVEHIVIDVQERFCIQFPPSRKTSRIIRLPKDINDLLQTYIKKYDRIEGAVFYNKHQTRLKVRDAQRILNHYIELGMECQKIHKHFTFQDLRHSAFKYMLAGGASEDEAAAYGGITTKWLSRYRHIVHVTDALDSADYSIIQIRES